MAVKRDSRYPGRWSPSDADFPLGGPKNRTTSTAKDGSYFERDFMADYESFFQRLMSESGLLANGTPDTAPTSQFFAALNVLGYGFAYSAGVNYPAGAYAKGSDGYLYRALTPNGPASTIVDPVGDNSGAWVSQFRAKKGAPTNDNSQVGYAFDTDGDSGLFAEGGSPSQSLGMVLRSDGEEIGRFTKTDKNVATTGFVRLPSGVIVQWGEFTSSDNGSTVPVNIPLPVTYTTIHAFCICNANNGLGTSIAAACTVELMELTQWQGFTVGAAASRLYNWISIGI